MKSYKMKINGEKYNAKIVSFDSEQAKIEVNGNLFLVEFEEDPQNPIPKLTRTTREAPTHPHLSSEFADGVVKAPIPGVIHSIKKRAGDRIEKGETILILEAMKMESEIDSPGGGVIEEVMVKEKSAVREGDVLVKVKFDAIEEAPAPKKAVKPKSKPTPAPVPTPAPTTQPAQAGVHDVVAPIPGLIMDVLVKEGDKVAADQTVIILEAMKMNSEISTAYAGTVKKVLTSKGQTVQEGEVLIQLGD